METLKSTINSYTMSSTIFCDNGKEMLIIMHELCIVFKLLQKKSLNNYTTCSTLLVYIIIVSHEVQLEAQYIGLD